MGAVRTLAVLSALTASSEDSVSTELIFEAVRAAIEFRLTPPLIDAAKADQFRLGDLVRKCGMEIPCLIAPLRAAAVELAVVIAVDVESKPPLFTMVMIDVGSGAEVARVLGELNERGREGALASIRRSAEQLIDRTGLGYAGRAAFTLKPADADVRFHSAETFGSELTLHGRVFKMRPGTHRATISRPGYREHEVELTMTAKAETNVTIILEPETSVFESPWFWGATVASVVALAVGTVVVLAAPDDACVCVDTTGAGCTAMRGAAGTTCQ